MTTNYTDGNSSLKEFENLLAICSTTLTDLENLLGTYGTSGHNYNLLLNDFFILLIRRI